MTHTPTPKERSRARDLLRLGWGRGSRLLDDDESRWLRDRAKPGEQALDAALRLAGIVFNWRNEVGWNRRSILIEGFLARAEARERVRVCVECGTRPAEIDGRCRGCSACVACPTA